METLRFSNRSVAVCAVLWVTALGAGFTVLSRYKSTPARVDAGVPAGWPAESAISRSADGPTLVLFAHPRCPCTHATISETARLLAGVPGRVSTHVLVVAPAGVPEGWTDTALWSRAAAIPGVRIWRDEGGREAVRFRANVSGLVLLYDEAGRLRFRGGITAARGHEGDSLGARRLRAVLGGKAPDRADSPVFGCGLGVEAEGGPTSEAEEGMHEDDPSRIRG